MASKHYRSKADTDHGHHERDLHIVSESLRRVLCSESGQMKAPLSQTHPDLAAQWHPTKNGELTPDMVSAGSGKNVWWKCPNGPDHEWQIKVQSRTREGSGCPCCDGVKVSITNSLASLFPQLASQWHPTKNVPLTPDK